MKSFLEMANDKPKLSKDAIKAICHEDVRVDRKTLKKAGLGGMEKMESWGVP